MTIYDISSSLSSETIIWPGDTPIEIRRSAEIGKGDLYNLSHIAMTAHAGTHVDAPSHFIENGMNAESLDLAILCGMVSIVYLPGLKRVDAGDLQKAGIPDNATRLIIKTDNSSIERKESRAFITDYCALSESAAEWVVKRGIRLIGIDYLSIAPFYSLREIHILLLSAGIIIVEGLELFDVEPGEYELYCLPLKIEGCDGSPARAILIKR